jgi:hypothetical protein
MEHYQKSTSNGSPKSPTHPPICHRCGALAPKRGRMSASVADGSGKARRLYLCRLCIASLSSWHALYRHAEAAEREESRQMRRVA